MSFEITAQIRQQRGTGASRRLRRHGKVPGVVYGAAEAAVAIELEHNALYHALREERFHASVLNLKINNQGEAVLLRDVQYHSFKPLVLHVDFQRINAQEKIHIKVPLHFTHADNCPGVKLAGGTVSHITTEIEIACLPNALPEFIEVNLAELKAGQSVHLDQIQAPEGVEFPALMRGENPTLASVIGVKAEASSDNASESQTS